MHALRMRCKFVIIASIHYTGIVPVEIACNVSRDKKLTSFVWHSNLFVFKIPQAASNMIMEYFVLNQPKAKRCEELEVITINSMKKIFRQLRNLTWYHYCMVDSQKWISIMHCNWGNYNETFYISRLGDELFIFFQSFSFQFNERIYFWVTWFLNLTLRL